MLRNEGGGDRSVGRVRRFAGLFVGMVLVVGVVFVVAGGGSAAPLPGPSVTKLNDADHDGVFSVTENVPKSVTYPWVVTYQVTFNAGTALPHRIDSFADSNTSSVGSCAALVGTTIAAGRSVNSGLYSVRV